jgi:hypothetical protein
VRGEVRWEDINSSQRVKPGIGINKYSPLDGNLEVGFIE